MTTLRPKRKIKPMQRLHPMVVHATNGTKPEKRITKHFKGKKKNDDAYDNTTATILAHVLQTQAKNQQE